MKIAVISDIHGNYDALCAVLKRAKRENVQQLLVLGDIVGYYYHPDKILNALAEWDYDIIKGNHEYLLEDLIANPSLGEPIQLKYGSGHQEAISKLTKKQLEYLRDLPDTKSVKFNNISLLMCHGSPWSNDYYIYPDCEKKVILKCDSVEHDFVLIGHSHYPFVIKNSNSILINSGSVGQSRLKGGVANWTLIDSDDKSYKIMETPYDVSELLLEIKHRDPNNNYLLEVLTRKANLNQ
jgi:putative phosphoesterase